MKIVTESSACLPGYRRTLLDADHRGMCKFKDENDINYIRVSGLLGRWAEELRKPQNKVAEKESVNTYAEMP